MDHLLAEAIQGVVIYHTDGLHQKRDAVGAIMRDANRIKAISSPDW